MYTLKTVIEKESGIPPTFTKPILIAFSEEQSKATITCQVSGQPKPEIKWKFGNQIILPDKNTQITYDEVTGEVTLELYNTPEDQILLYTLEAENTFGTAVAKAQLILAGDEPPKLLKSPQLTPLHAQIVKPKSTLVMESYYDGVPEPTIQWYKNGREIVPDRFLSIKTENQLTTLTIELMDRKRAGKYEVVAINEAGESRSSGTVVVSDEIVDKELIPPMFIKPLKPRTVLSDEVVLMEVEVDSKPNSSFQWFFNAMPLKVSPIVRVNVINNRAILMIEKFAEEHSGIYMCRAENVAGSVTTTASVKLVDNENQLEEIDEYLSPRFIETLKPMQLMDGDSLDLVCRVIGNPTPKIEWYQDKQLLLETRGISIIQDDQGYCSLNVPESFTEDTGVYTCYATNKYGKASTEANVIVEGIFFVVYDTYFLA